MSRLYVRARGWDTALARIRLVGFTFHDDGKDAIDVVRDGRRSRMYLINRIAIEADDPRDMWLLREAVGGDWPARETYYLRRVGDGDIIPVELRLGHYDNELATLYVEHDMLDGRNERIAVNSVEELMDVLLPLGPTNSIGYHSARDKIIDAFERLRPKTWADVCVDDAAVIAEYERYQVTPDHVAHARAGGRMTVDEIIAGYGIPPFEGWIDNRSRSDQ